MIKQKSIKYLSNCGKLIHYSIVNKTYRILNEKDSPILSKEEFDTLSIKRINNQLFSKMMNDYFRNIKAEWEYQGNKYKKLPNFETNYLGGYNQKEIPRHEISKHTKGIIVFHWGKLYYLGFYSSDGRGVLFDYHSKQFCQWVNAKNCAPVFNQTDKRII